MNKRDMHLHTTFSDGSLAPARVVTLAARLGLSEIAITDHDTMEGVPQAAETGKTLGISVVPGVELSAYDYQRGRKVHLLGYRIRDAATLESACRPFLQSRHMAQLQAVEKVMEAGYPLTQKEVFAYTGPAGTLYRQHIMHALVDRGYALAIYGPLYKKLFAKNGLAFVPSQYMDVFEALRLIRDTGGLAVLAHPFQYDSLDLLTQLVEQGLHGLETRHSKHSEQQVAHLHLLARKYRLEPFTGSDFHGFYSEQATPIGGESPPTITEYPRHKLVGPPRP